jgi:predicted RNA-binding Zn ribbon-like protein
LHRQTVVSGRPFILVAARPALDLCNTQLGDVDLLATPEDLSRWLVATGLSDQPVAISPKALESARRLRAALRPALMESDADAVATIAEGWFESTPGRLCVEPGTLTPRFTPAARSTDCLMVPAVIDALDLVRETPGRVRECAAERCPVIYLDTSRNRSRRWCSMEVCGSRAKAAAYYRRRRRDGGP